MARAQCTPTIAPAATAEVGRSRAAAAVNVLQLQFVVEPNLNHFSLSEDEVGMFAHFLRAALQQPEPSTDQGGETRQR